MSAARTIRMVEDRGIAGLHLEDQVNPKRCGHLDGKAIVPADAMLQKIKAAVDARRDDRLLVIARSDARAVEGLDAMIERANLYAEAGADMIFAEALQNEDEWRHASSHISAPLLANMTEFGKSDLLSANDLQELGASLVIYPVTTLRIAMKAVLEALDVIAETGTQRDVVDRMQTRQELYDLLRYEDYNRFDQDLFNFKL
jgi:methylisocitrate lyase